MEVTVPSSLVPKLIGRQGAMIISINTEFHVKVLVPDKDVVARSESVRHGYRHIPIGNFLPDAIVLLFVWRMMYMSAETRFAGFLPDAFVFSLDFVRHPMQSVNFEFLLTATGSSPR
jgi:hypothetical protein